MAITLSSGNLIVNPDAESGSAATDFGSSVAPDGWSVTGAFTAVAYDIGGTQDLNADDTRALQGGTAYFAGGPAAFGAVAQQTIDVTAFASDIDLGIVRGLVSGQFGGFLNQDDRMSLTVLFLDDLGLDLDSLEIGGATALDRNFQTTLISDFGALTVPIGTRTIVLTLTATYGNGSYNDGYADNLGLEFTGLSSGLLYVEGKQDLSGESVDGATGIAFDPLTNSSVVLSSSQFGANGIALDSVIQASFAKDKLTIRSTSNETFSIAAFTFEGWSKTKDKLTLIGRGGAEDLTGSSINDTIRGAGGDDIISGRGGADTLDGQGGIDTLIGGNGNDKFVLANLTEDRDIIIDFVSGGDVMKVSASLFGGGLAAGEDLGTKFLANDTGLAAGGEDRFIYDTTDGQLYFDADGTGIAERVLVAVLSGAPLVVASDFAILA